MTGSFSTLDLSVVVYLTLTETAKLNIGFDEFQHKMIAQVHQRVDRSASHLNLSIETYTQIWESVFYIPMPKLKVGFSKKLIETVKFYIEHKVSSYDDYTAQTILFSSTNTSLSSIYPESATDEDYHDAMKSVIPPNNKSIYKYWQQLNLIMNTTVSSGYLSKNPIVHLLPDIKKGPRRR